MQYDAIIVGGGIAGLQAAIQLGRYGRQVMVLDAEDGRSVLCRAYHNVLGWPEGISGQQLRALGRKQAEQLAIQFEQGTVCSILKLDGGWAVRAEGAGEAVYCGQRLLLATGIKDRLPVLEGLLECLGKSVYICPDCDGFEVKGSKTVVIGSGEAGAAMALTLLYWTNDIILVEQEEQPTKQEELRAMLADRGIRYIASPVQRLLASGGQLTGVALQNGERIAVRHAFIAMGGNRVRSELAVQLGVKVADNGHVWTDPRTKMTSVPNIWAAGDIGIHSEQLVIAMGEGAQAAIWIHKSLL